MMENIFDREKHVYRNDEFAELLKDAVRFFHGTPVFPIPPPEPFSGSGVYALYYIGKAGIYSKFGNEINRTGYNIPIYVGKAVPEGWRQSRTLEPSDNKTKLFSRIKEHSKSIQSTKNLNMADFHCRFMIFEGDARNMIAAVEAILIAEKTPLWNSVVDGFGNHAPGKERKTGRLPAWDVLHPGRGWTTQMEGDRPEVKDIQRRVKDYLVGLRT
jgi:hypothetical protein